MKTPIVQTDGDIVFSNLTIGYDHHPAVHHLSLRIPAGALVALVGPNGAGKSTLLKTLVGELKPIHGQIELPKERRIAYLPQVATVDTGFPISVFDFVAAGLWHAKGAFLGLGRTARAQVTGALDQMGIGALMHRPIGALSGGQLQRVRFARLALQDAPIILLDEPYTGIDEATLRDLADQVDVWHTEGKTILSVLHDFGHVRSRYPMAVLLAREMVASGAPAEVLSPANLDRARGFGEVAEPAAEICRGPEVLQVAERVL